MRLIDFGLIVLLGAGCNQISGADDFTFDDETDEQPDGGEDLSSDTQEDTADSDEETSLDDAGSLSD